MFDLFQIIYIFSMSEVVFNPFIWLHWKPMTSSVFKSNLDNHLPPPFRILENSKKICRSRVIPFYGFFKKSLLFILEFFQKKGLLYIFLNFTFSNPSAETCSYQGRILFC